MNTKICSKCKRCKTLDEFCKHPATKDRRQMYCKACANEAAKIRRLNNPKKIREQQKEYDSKRGEYFRRYRQNNQEKIRQAASIYRKENKDKLAELVARWQKNNPDKVRASSQRRRARKRGALGAHTAEDMRRQYDNQKGCCWWCGEFVGWEEHEDDHLVPLSRGGTNAANNMVVSCRYCNRSKGKKLPHEFAGRLF